MTGDTSGEKREKSWLIYVLWINIIFFLLLIFFNLDNPSNSSKFNFNPKNYLSYFSIHGF